jgi:hypothetical protein
LLRLWIIKNSSPRYCKSSPETIRLVVALATLIGARAPVVPVLLVTLSGYIFIQEIYRKVMYNRCLISQKTVRF